ncbi:ATP-binding protein [Flavobacterium sp.]|uniref:ATP-binding protein n=1 Tax=Flavobacterium sp. TaxID=239 RepID=UPI0031DF01FE
MNRKLTTNSRLVNELFASYFNTFAAFSELMNNSIQAKANNIWIDIDYAGESEIYPTLIKSLKIKDDGNGVHSNDIQEKLLDIGTTNKDGGKGIGRFACFQLGKKIAIETVGFSTSDKTYSKVEIPLHFDMFGKNLNVSEIVIPVNEQILKGAKQTYYQVEISEFYDSIVTEKETKKKIIEKFLPLNIADAIFEKYPLKIFNKNIAFHINGNKIEPSHFIIDKPIHKIHTFIDLKGNKHKVIFNFIQIKKQNKIKIFLTTNNAGIQTIANGFEYDASWLSPKIGGWYVYIESNTLPTDLYRNIDLDELDEDWKAFRQFIKDNLVEFYKARNAEFDNFTEKLKNDEYYPFKDKTSSSKSKVMVFDKLAFLVEDKYHLLHSDNKLREIIYPLIDRTISNGELDNILKNILHLNTKLANKFSELLEKTSLDNVIEFSDKVAKKVESLEFLEKLVYSELSKNVKERKELHKFLERMLWVFGEEYNETTNLLSDKNLKNNLIQLRNDCLEYKASKKDDNIDDSIEKSVRSITDLFLYNERVIDHKRREVLVVELKAPKVKISPKELEQVMKYATEIDKLSSISQNVNFKILLISSTINSDAEYRINGNRRNEDNPYFYFRNENKNIEIWVMKWSDLIENVRRKLTYMSNILHTKDVDVQEKAAKDFEDIEVGKYFSTLKKVAL